MTNDTLKEFKLEQTRDLVNAALALDPVSPQAWELSGELHFYQQKFHAAIGDFTKVSGSMNPELYKYAISLSQLKPDSRRLSSDILLKFLKEASAKVANNTYAIIKYANLLSATQVRFSCATII